MNPNASQTLHRSLRALENCRDVHLLLLRGQLFRPPLPNQRLKRTRQFVALHNLRSLMMLIGASAGPLSPIVGRSHGRISGVAEHKERYLENAENPVEDFLVNMVENYGN